MNEIKNRIGINQGGIIWKIRRTVEIGAKNIRNRFIQLWLTRKRAGQLIVITG